MMNVPSADETSPSLSSSAAALRRRRRPSRPASPPRVASVSATSLATVVLLFCSCAELLLLLNGVLPSSPSAAAVFPFVAVVGAAAPFRAETSYAYSHAAPPASGRNGGRLIWTRTDLDRLRRRQMQEIRRQQQQAIDDNDVSEPRARLLADDSVTAEPSTKRNRFDFLPVTKPTPFRSQFRPKLWFGVDATTTTATATSNPTPRSLDDVEDDGKSAAQNSILLPVDDLLDDVKPPEVAAARKAVLGQALKFADEVHNFRKTSSATARQRRRLSHPSSSSSDVESPDAVHAFNEIGKGGAYEFGYKVNSILTADEHYRHEQRLDDGTVIGSYGLRDADGMVRIVDYVADGRGFRATVRKSRDDGPPTITELGVPAKSPELLLRRKRASRHPLLSRRKRDVVIIKNRGQSHIVGTSSSSPSPPTFLTPPPLPQHLPEEGGVEDDYNAVDYEENQNEVVDGAEGFGGEGELQVTESPQRFDFTHRLTEFRDPLPTIDNRIDDHTHHQHHHHHHINQPKQHMEPPIITAEDLEKLQSTNSAKPYSPNLVAHAEHDDNSGHRFHKIVKVSVGVLASSEIANYAPLYPPIAQGHDLPSLIPALPPSLPDHRFQRQEEQLTSTIPSSNLVPPSPSTHPSPENGDNAVVSEDEEESRRLEQGVFQPFTATSDVAKRRRELWRHLLRRRWKQMRQAREQETRTS